MGKINILYDQSPESARLPDPPPGLPECMDCGQPAPFGDGEYHYCRKHTPDDFFVDPEDPDARDNRPAT